MCTRALLWSDACGCQGVTIPSQVRYVNYYGRYIKERLTYRAVPLLLTRIVFHGHPSFSAGTCGKLAHSAACRLS